MKKTITYFQPMHRDSGCVPDGMTSFDVFKTRGDCEKFLKDRNLSEDYDIVEYRDGDIEDPTWLNADGAISGSGPVPADTLREADSFREKLSAIGHGVYREIVRLLKARGIESLNVIEYIRNNKCTNYAFFDVDGNGFAGCLCVETLRFDEHDCLVADLTENGEDVDWGEYDVKDMNSEEQVDLLFMVEEILRNIRDEHLPVLKAGEEFED